MKPIFYFSALLAFAVALFTTACASRTHRPLPTASRVDLARYAGHWYEVFRLPNQFQKDDAKAEADYRLQTDGSVRVVNTETRPGGKRKTVKGSATVVPDGQNSRLKVKFEGLAALAPVPDEGNYWIIRLEDDYSTALVGTPDRKFLWMLARERRAGASRVGEYKALAHSLGFDTSKVIQP